MGDTSKATAARVAKAEERRRQAEAEQDVRPELGADGIAHGRSTDAHVAKWGDPHVPQLVEEDDELEDESAPAPKEYREGVNGVMIRLPRVDPNAEEPQKLATAGRDGHLPTFRFSSDL